MKTKLFFLFAVVALAFSPVASRAADTAPKSVIHVITVAWKPGTTADQIQAALDGAQKLPSQYPGIIHVWTRPLKVQNVDEAIVKKTHIIVMEFSSEQAFKNYTDSPAQQEWYKVYLAIREQSTTYDVTN